MEIVRRNGCRCPLRGNAGGWPLVRRVLSGEGEGRPCASLWRVDCLVLSLGCAGRVARYLFHVRSRRADVSYGVVKGWFAGCRASLRCRQGAGASFFTAVVLRIAGFPALARNGLPDSFLFQGGALPSVVIAGILRADAVPEKPLPRAGVYRDRIVDKKIPPFCGGIFTCN